MRTSEIADFEGYLRKLSLAFTGEERAWFVDSFARHMKYRSNPGAFVISIDDIVKWLEFAQKNTAVKLLMTHFKEGVDFELALPMAKARSHGGHNKTEYLLSVRTFKKMCMIAKTAKADTVRDYYIKMEEVLMDHHAEQAQLSVERARSDGIISGNIHSSLTYIFALLLQCGKRLYKLGYTDGNGNDIRERVDKARAKFGVDVLVEEVFRCARPKLLEQRFLYDTRFASRKFLGPINQTTSTEVFDFTRQDLAAFKLAIRKEYTKAAYQGISAEDRKLAIADKELALQKMRLDMLKEGYSPEDIERVSKTSSDTTSQDVVRDDGAAEEEECRSRMDSNGMVVYVYDPSDLSNHVKSFSGITEATRNVANSSYSNIKEVANNCTVYRGYRWQLVPRGLASVPRLAPTVEGQKYRTGFVARLTEQGAVAEVLVNQDKWAKRLGVTPGAISLSLSKGKYSYTGNVHLALWDTLDEDLKSAYLKDHTLPDKPQHHGSKTVLCTHVETGTITRFKSMVDLRKERGATKKVVDRCIRDDNYQHYGYRYNYA